MTSECTQQSVLRFLQEKGGRVKNRELIDHFRVGVTRDHATFKVTLKRFVDSVAFVKQEDGEKFVCLKKRYREEMLRAFEGNDGECNGNGFVDLRCTPKRAASGSISEAMQDRNGNEPSAGKALHENCTQGLVTDSNICLSVDLMSSLEISDSTNMGRQDTEHKPYHPISKTAENNIISCALDHHGVSEGLRPIKHESTNLKDSDKPICPLSESSRSDEKSSTINDDLKVHESHVKTIVGLGLNSFDSDVAKGLAPSVITRRTSRGSQRSLLGLSEEGIHGGAFDYSSVGDSTPKGSRKNFIDLMMSSSPQVRRTLVHRNSQGNLVARNREPIKSDGDNASLDSSADEDCTAAMLEPLEHEWMMCASDGQWENLQRLLLHEPNLFTKKDFVTGFTCLHWAAKQGKSELIAKLFSFGKEHGMPVILNARSSAGYTPLHLAAMHDHVEVVKLLVGTFNADVEVRDYSGKKAFQYLSDNLACDIKHIVGASGDSDAENAESGAGRWRLPKVLPSNFNPLRLLNHPDDAQWDNGAVVRPRSLYRKSSLSRIRLNRNRFKTQIVHSTSFRETDESEGSIRSPVKPRPLSNLFG